MSTSDDAPLEQDTKAIVARVFHEMGIEPLTPKEREEGFSLGPGESRTVEVRFPGVGTYRAPEKSVPFAGDQNRIPWGVIILFMALAVTCAFAIGWSLSELGLL